MNKISHYKYKFSLLVSFFLILLVSSCEDRLDFNQGEIDGSIRDVSVTINFEPLTGMRLSSSRAAADGNSIQDISSLRMLVYDKTGQTLLYDYHVWDNNGAADTTGDISSESYNQYTPDADGLKDNETAKLTYNLKIPSGEYYIYAVANAEDVLLNQDYSTREKLKAINCTWNLDNVTENSEMFGVFSLNNDKNAYTEDKPVKISNTTIHLYCWLRRLASKVTVAFDGTDLYDDVQVYIETISICDIPKQCSLGNPNIPGIKPNEALTYDYKNLYEKDKSPAMLESADRYTVDNGLHSIGDTVKIQTVNTALSIVPDDYYHVCKTRHPYLGMGSDSGNNDDETIISKAHAHKAKALFFYENMQGLSPSGKTKYQDADGNGRIDNPDPVENNLDSGWKDGKAYGTYIEVTGYYRCTELDGHVSSGPIIYRFMLGKNVENDFNAERNHHYQLTLKFKGYGNDADWHIEYEHKRGIEVQSPLYISYLFNKKMMAPVRVSGVLPEGAKLRADIIECRWEPWGDGTKSFPKPNKDFYSPVSQNYGAWNSFLSTRQTKVVKIEIPDKEGIPSNLITFSEAWEYNEKYYTDNNRGWRTYEVTPLNSGYDSNDGDGMYFVTALSADDNGNITERLFSIPFFTRAKELITRVGFTGNNPYTEYPRSAKVKLSIVDKDGKELSDFTPATLQIIQVRRIVNPKGVWRKSGSTEPFHVTLMRLADENSDFDEFNSEGKWYAEILTSTTDNVVSLSSTSKGSGSKNKPQYFVRRIEGESEHPIDFYINFNGIDGCAIIRVRYHNGSCEHDIFCREGYDPIDVTGDGKLWWRSFNVESFDGKTAQFTKSPLQQGSFFRRENYTAILAENDKNYGFNTHPGDFKVKKDDGTEDTMAWSAITPSKQSSTPSNWTIDNTDEHIPTGDDFYTFVAPVGQEMTFKISKAYGVLYGDGARETQKERIKAYEYDRTDGADDERGMRGVFVYNTVNGAQIFFPIGMTGYGHRQSYEGVLDGTLRYAGREALMKVSDNKGDFLAQRPLFYDLYKRPGAIYWMQHYYTEVPNYPGKDYIDSSKSSAFDMNYYTMGFEGYGNNDAIPNKIIANSHGCFIRTVLTKAPK